jgi:hypothetical protein
LADTTQQAIYAIKDDGSSTIKFSEIASKLVQQSNAGGTANALDNFATGGPVICPTCGTAIATLLTDVTQPAACRVDKRSASTHRRRRWMRCAYPPYNYSAPSESRSRACSTRHLPGEDLFTPFSSHALG